MTKPGVATLMLLVACNPAGPDRLPAEEGILVENTRPVWSASEAWYVGEEPLLELGASDIADSILFYDPQSVFVDQRGRYFIADGMSSGQQAVIVLDSAGGFQQRIGRRGRGPGEFRQVLWARPYRGDSVAVYDFVGTQVSLFDSDGRHGRDVPVGGLRRWDTRTTASENVVGPFADGSLLAYTMGTLPADSAPGAFWTTHAIVRVDESGVALERLGRFNGSLWRLRAADVRYREPVPLGPEGLLAIGDTTFYSARGDRFEIAEYNSTGRLLRTIRRPFPVNPATPAEIEDYRRWHLDALRRSPEGGDLERERRRLDALEYPDVLPAISNLLVDVQGNLWVQHWRWFRRVSRPTSVQNEWSVFDRHGRWLGTLQIPAGLILEWIGTDRIIGFWRDQDDVDRVLVYRLIKPGG